MPAAANSGPVTRRQSKRKSTAITEDSAESAESVAKRVKTEAATQDQSQIEGEPGNADEFETVVAEMIMNNINNEDGLSPSSEEEPEIPARPATVGELLNQYLLERTQTINGISQQFNQQFSDEAMSRFGWTKEGEVVEWPSDGVPALLPEWQRSYALKRDIEVFKGYSSYKAKEAKHALQAVRALEQCKRAKDRVIGDEAFIKKWQLRWQREILAQSELMFNSILKPLQSHKRTLEVTGQNLSNEITGFARRQTM
ncbi:hypothetical protein M436DRAFT_79435 [Aureobasidium namibiae CBS 147.97]|uniref:Uncharacterized protein n=1 Tax=Aureobasidium namibiae CBS 147.97 TaxID=1043004 RepID=A0A074WSN2_9PEZI